MGSTTYQHITIIGLGLIGSSVARAVKHYGVAEHIIAYDTNPLALQLGEQQGFVSRAVDSLPQALEGAELVVIASPPSASLKLISEIAEHIPQDALVTDTLSVKTDIAEAFKQHLADGAVAIPAHPIAGSEKTGAAAGRADLFAGKRIILTPETPDDAGIEAISDFWEALGGMVEYMPPDVHDMVYAYVSHLPQLLAFAYVPYIERIVGNEGLPEHFSQFTRLCDSDQYLWNDIFTHNKQQLDQAMARFLVLLSHIRSELAESEPQATDKQEISDVLLWGHWIPRLVASSLVATIAQQSRDAGFNFLSFAGSGFVDFTAPLQGEPDADMEAISNYAPQVVAALDQLLTSLSEWVVIKD